MTYRAWDLKTLDRAAVRELTHAIAEQRTEELEYSAMDEEPWSEQKYAATLAAQYFPSEVVFSPSVSPLFSQLTSSLAVRALQKRQQKIDHPAS